MIVYIGADHRGFLLKERLKKYLKKLGYLVKDSGAFSYNPNDDYPDFVTPVAKNVSKSKGIGRGIVIGGSGQGEAMAANRVRGVRAAVYYGGAEKIIKLSREHNDANVLSLAAFFVKTDRAKKMVKLWLETKFSNETRHKRRIGKLDFK